MKYNTKKTINKDYLQLGKWLMKRVKASIEKEIHIFFSIVYIVCVFMEYISIHKKTDCHLAIGFESILCSLNDTRMRKVET